MKTLDLNRYALALLLTCLSTLASGGEWISDASGCKLWNSYPKPGESVTWSGSCRDGYAEGPGAAEYFMDGQLASRFEGTLENGKVAVPWYARAGRGTLSWPKGDRYEGDLVDGKRTGKGVYVFASGDRYEGDFVDAKITGKGVYVFASGNRYEGDVVDGKITGKGVYVWPKGDRYEGDFVDGKRTGQGVYVFASGARYEGDVVDGKRTGQGVYVFANGAREEGGFVDGKLDGEGIQTKSNGHSNVGTFSNGKFVDGYVVDRNGKAYGEVVGGLSNWGLPDDSARSATNIVGALLGVVQGVASARGRNAAPYQAHASATGSAAQSSGGVCSSGWPPASEISRSQSFCEKCEAGVFRKSGPVSWDCKKNGILVHGCYMPEGKSEWTCLSQ